MYVEESVVQKAVDQTGFGKFNIKVAIVTSFIFLNTAFCITSVGFVISTAACDFKMTTIDKGRINAAPMLGMVAGTWIWGYVADLKGRRAAIVASLLLQFASDFLASLIPSYWAFVFLKFISGIGVTGQLSIVFPYVGEFQPVTHRNKMLTWLDFPWCVGVIVVAIFAWAIIPLELRYEAGVFSFASWNLFVLLSSFPALLSALWLLQFPETPKFLGEDGQHTKLLSVLIRMYKENTGGTDDEFKERLRNCGLPALNDLVDRPDTSKTDEQARRGKLAQLISDSKDQAKALVKRPYGKRLFICGSIMFCMSSTYYSMMTWFPELFQRFAAFERNFPDESASVCSVSQIRTSNVSLIQESNDEANSDPFGCDSRMDTSVYVNSALLGVACLPCAILLPLTVNQLGYRVYLVFTAAGSLLMTIGFFFVETTTQNLVISCIFEALTSVNTSINLCLLVDLFPTNLRVIATGITVFIGRTGSFFGNMLFGYLIDAYCPILIIAMAAQLLVAAILGCATPGRDKLRKIQGHPDSQK